MNDDCLGGLAPPGSPGLPRARPPDLLNGVGRPLCYGAIDVKFVSVKEITEGKNIVHIISGPTNDKQPTFSWKNTTCDQSNPMRWYHEDVVDTWNFPWIDYQVQLFDN